MPPAVHDLDRAATSPRRKKTRTRRILLLRLVPEFPREQGLASAHKPRLADLASISASACTLQRLKILVCRLCATEHTVIRCVDTI